MRRREFGFTILTAGAFALAAAEAHSQTLDRSSLVRDIKGGGRQITPAQFKDYMAAFHRGDFDRLAARYYAPDVVFQGRGRNFDSAAKVIEFYKGVREHLTETIAVKRAYFGEDGFSAELETTLVAHKDWPDFFGGPMKVGDVKRSQNFVFYTVRDGRMVHIRSANFAQLT